MSSFFVEDGVIDDVIALWGQSLPLPQSYEDRRIRGRGLLRMNCAAVLARYPRREGTDEHHDMSDCAETYSPVASTQPIEQLVKSAVCLRYQCNEGDVSDTWTAFDWLDKLIKAQPRHVLESPDFEKAIWNREREG